jgi:hypothetical protein
MIRQLFHDVYAIAHAFSLQGDYHAIGDAEGQVHSATSHDLSNTSPLVDQETASLKSPLMHGFTSQFGGSRAAVDWPDVPLDGSDVSACSDMLYFVR